MDQLVYKQIQNQQITMKQIWLLLVVAIEAVYSYLDIQLEVHRLKNYTSYSVPVTINSIQYWLSTSFADSNEFILAPAVKAASNKKNKKHKAVDSASVTGILKASSLEGYSFEGWRRFFMEALLYVQSRYYHQIPINFEGIQLKKQVDEFQRDGLISFGPGFTSSKIYQRIKNGSDFVKNDVVSIYRGVNDKNVRMQLGGFEETFARGHRNGILFYEMPITPNNGKWRLLVKSTRCLSERNGKMVSFFIASSEVNLYLSIQSQWLILPMSFATQLQRNFESTTSTCKITQQNRFSCANMSSIDLSLNFISFQIDENAFINITLHDLMEQYNQKTHETLFYIKFTQNQNEYQIGEALFKSYYISVDMGNKKMLFSPINRFPDETYGVYVIRFFIFFGIFTIAAAVGAMIWQTFNDPFRKNKLMMGQNGGVRLVSYQKPMQSDNQIGQ